LFVVNLVCALVQFRRLPKCFALHVVGTVRVCGNAFELAGGFGASPGFQVTDGKLLRNVVGVFAVRVIAPEILENVIEGLFGIAKADGPIDVAEAAYLAEVAQIFGLSSARFERAKAAALGVVECEPCTILGIDPLATDEQIREAWLRQVKANHPDRLMAQGLPEEAIAMANRKLALINDAYDRLRRERGLVLA